MDGEWYYTIPETPENKEEPSAKNFISEVTPADMSLPLL